MFCGIGLDCGLRFGKAVGCGKIERQLLETQPHDMAVRIDKAGQHRRAACVMAEIQLLGQFVLFGQQRGDLAVLADENGIKADDLTVFVERDAVDIFDQTIGQRRAGERQ